MKRIIIVSLCLIAFILSFIIPTQALSTEEQISQLNSEISQIETEMSTMSDGLNVIVGTVVATDPYFIVSGMGLGEETTLSPYPNFIIENPEVGQIYGLNMYEGPHKYLGTKVLYDSYGVPQTYNVMGAMPDKWYALRTEKLEKKAQLASLQNSPTTESSASDEPFDLTQLSQDPEHEILFEIDNPTISVHGKNTKIDSVGTMPVLVNYKPYIPLRALIENIGGTISWDNATYTVLITLNNGNQINLSLSNNYATVNGKTVSFDNTPILYNSKTMVPLSFITNCLEIEADWNALLQIIYIKYSVPEESLIIIIE